MMMDQLDPSNAGQIPSSRYTINRMFSVKEHAALQLVMDVDPM